VGIREGIIVDFEDSDLAFSMDFPWLHAKFKKVF